MPLLCEGIQDLEAKPIGPALGLIICRDWAYQVLSIESFCLSIRAAAVELPSLGHGRIYEVSEHGIAIVRLCGALSKARTNFGDSTVDARRTILAAVADERVRGVLLVIESAGGTVAGTQLLAETIASASNRKPIDVFIEDAGMSAAYWIASQANRITMNRTGQAGGLGVYSIAYDSSKRFEDAGLKVHVVRSGLHKGAGALGSRIHDEHLRAWQHRVDQLGQQFFDDVSRGRKLTAKQLDAVSDGRVFIGEEAREKGLVDEIGSIDDAYSALVERTRKASR